MRTSPQDWTTQPDTLPLRRSSVGWIAAAVFLLALLTVLSGITSSPQNQMALRWMAIAVMVASAWACPPRFALLASLTVIVAETWIETRSPIISDWLPGHPVRLAVAMGLVIWVLRLRRQLETARRLARIDSLTGLPNRQALIESLEAEISRAKRFGRPFSVAVLDCDGFKQINDQRGHLAGDEVLRRIGESLRQQIRPFDCAGRWGGDEFTVILPETDCDDARLIAERLRAAMRHNVARMEPTLTFSLGVITIRNPVLGGWQQYLHRADEAMYAAKRIGRDQTRFETI